MWISQKQFEELQRRLELLEIKEELNTDSIIVVADILDGIVYRQNAAHVIEITQDGEQTMGVLTGTPIGGVSTFTAAFLQAQGGAAGTLQAGNIPQWSSKDANVKITQSADGTQASVALGAGETSATYDLTVSAVNSDGNAITNTINVPVLPAVVAPPPPPPDTAATFIDIEQTS